jgi:GH35 family endo-1,4-beta-xylanase
VKIQQTRHAFLFGSNIFKLGRCRTPEDNAAYEKHFAELLNYATLPFYWWDYEREQGKSKDARTLEIVHWCREHDVTAKGHPLAWNWVDPPWLPDDLDTVRHAQFFRSHAARQFAGDRLLDVVNGDDDRPNCQQNAR